jgi:hypothetical protein
MLRCLDRGRFPIALRLLAALVLLAGLILGGIDLLYNRAYAAHGVLGGSAALALNLAALVTLLATRLAAPAARAAALLFAVYAGFNAAAWAAAEDHCGCFGALAIPPVAALTLDAVLAVTLLVTAWPPAGIGRTGVATVAVLAVGPRAGSGQLGIFVPAPPPVLPPVPPELAGDAGPDPAEAAVESAPLAEAAARSLAPDPSPAAPAGLDQGDWTLVLLRSDCADCQRFLNQQGPLLDSVMIAPGSTLLLVDLAAGAGTSILDHRLPPSLQRHQRQHAAVIDAARQRFRHHRVPSAVRMQSGMAFDEDLALRFGWR